MATIGEEIDVFMKRYSKADKEIQELMLLCKKLEMFRDEQILKEIQAYEGA